MKKNIGFIVIIILFLFSSIVIISAQHKFYVDLNNRSDDLFKVTIVPEKLSAENNIFQFASAAPGTYQIMDIGRYVRSFSAYDKDGDEVPVENISLNQWKISEPGKVSKVYYEIAETWDTEMEENPIYAMCGSSLEEDHAVINGHCVFGYFSGMQKYPIEIKLEYPQKWDIGTALVKNSNGYFEAPDYDFVVDSPIMLGNLSKASTKVDETTVDVFTYSKTGLIESENILSVLEDVLGAAAQFIGKLPVDRYVFLFHFEDFTFGAWEHSYSSFYVYKEEPLNEKLIQDIRSVAAHEFFHVVTPLNIHSELVANFNYEKPVMSKHLWLYEGVTEWASDIMLMRDYITTLEDYLKETKQKLAVNDNYDQTVSLTDLSVRAIELQDQYFNIYNKGAVVATLLDFELLKLSNGKKGLRELIIELANQYGPQKPFSEENFFDELVKITYPEIRIFINNYIDGNKKLPVAEYFDMIGIKYTEDVGYDSSRVSLGFGLGIKNNKLIVTNVADRNTSILNPGDYLYKVDDVEITLQNVQQVLVKYSALKVDEEFEFIILRNNEEIPVKIVAGPRAIRHEFKVFQDIIPAQLEMRNLWLQNLSLN